MKSFIMKSYFPAIITVILVAGSFFVGIKVGSRERIEPVTSVINKEPEAAAPKADFEPFWKAWSVLNQKYVSSKPQPSDQDKVWGAIEGLAASLGDPYTVFFPPEETKMFESDISGNFEGVGIEIALKDNILTVVAPIKGSPAERAGILSGDKIIKINSESTVDMSVDKAVKLIRGKRGTEMVLTIMREGKRESFEKRLVRDIIEIPTLDTEVKPLSKGAGSEPVSAKDGAFMIKLYSFSANSANLFRESLRKFKETGGDRLVIDLRGNPGGYLQSAVDMASYFLPAGRVVVSEDFGENEETRVYRSRGFNIFDDKLKLVILVNGGTASAAEILAGALREHGKATLVGSKTFGKGSVQELIKITPDTSLKVTVARWLTPKGNSISEGGLKPDHEVTMTPDDVEKKKDPQLEKAIELLR